MRIMLDPGHGGEDSGALSSCGRFRESAHVLDIARRLSSHLTLAGYEVRLTRQDDITAVPLAERTAMAAVWESDLLVSLHLNSASSGAARGIETYVLPPVGMRSTVQNHVAELSPAALAMMIREFSGNQHDEENHRLAQKIQHRMVATTPLPDRGVRFARYAVLRNASMPAVLVEAGFLSNRQDAAFLATPEGRENIALGIFRGIAEYAADRADAVPSSGSRVEGDAPVPGIPGAEGVFRERGET